MYSHEAYMLTLILVWVLVHTLGTYVHRHVNAFTSRYAESCVKRQVCKGPGNQDRDAHITPLS